MFVRCSFDNKCVIGLHNVHSIFLQLIENWSHPVLDLTLTGRQNVCLALIFYNISIIYIIELEFVENGSTPRPCDLDLDPGRQNVRLGNLSADTVLSSEPIPMSTHLTAGMRL